MADQPRNNEPASELNQVKSVKGGDDAVSGKPLPVAGEPASSNKLTAEQQMALYEKELKEGDWGHQPC
jgi:hypothetical protein